MRTYRQSVQKAAGFTLVELLVVITIIGLIMGLAIPALYGVFTKGKETAIKMEVTSIASALEKYRDEFGEYPPDFSDWAVVQRHYRKIFPRMLPGELTRLQLLTDIDTSNDTSTSASPVAHNPAAMDRGEALVWALGGFSKNPQLPFTGEGGPLEAVSITATAAVYQVNLDRVNKFFDLETAKMGLTKVDSNQPTSATNRYLSADDNDLFPSYQATKNGAPYVYFDARTYRFNAGTDAAPNFNGYASADYGNCRPYVSDIVNARTTTADFATRLEALESLQFMNEDKFQLLAPGLDGNYGVTANFDVNGDSVLDPVYYQYPTGKAIAGVTGSGINAAGDLLITDVSGFQEGVAFGVTIEQQLDNITDFSKLRIVDDIKEE